ncbi:DegT/DnrJ/EryC1/StrS family aminotransferase [Candidatus Pelagibacter bacterium]|nr:DegT/DnrJ/EryC1/StrS family aminotransferase [Candidatus Pelagibacter bacterium]MDA9625108.1 DegT/DnrJ/EryC1/StrS family aminotransferase [Candidatus Pelagibacter bacterium]
MIKFSKLNINKKDIKLVSKIITSGWLTHGKYTALFEKELKKFTGSKYCVTVANCTAGLHLSCLVAGFKKGDEVIVPAMTHTATANAVEFTGAKAVFSDVDYTTGNIKIENIKNLVTKKTKGLIIVHMAGISCDLDQIKYFCKKNKIKLIEDCAHALGTQYKRKHVGNFGITGNFSFYPTKQITTGEGGAIVTNSKKIYNTIKKLKAFGIDKDIKDRKIPGDYDVKLLGYNYRMTDFQAALGLQQIKNYRNNLKKRKLIARKYINKLKGFKNITIPKYEPGSSYFVFQILTKKRSQIIKIFKEKKIGFSIHYPNALPKMTYYKKKYSLKLKNYPNANSYGKNCISLPVYPLLKDRDINLIIKTISKELN